MRYPARYLARLSRALSGALSADAILLAIRPLFHSRACAAPFVLRAHAPSASRLRPCSDVAWRERAPTEGVRCAVPRGSHFAAPFKPPTRSSCGTRAYLPDRRAGARERLGSATALLAGIGYLVRYPARYLARLSRALSGALSADAILLAIRPLFHSRACAAPFVLRAHAPSASRLRPCSDVAWRERAPTEGVRCAVPRGSARTSRRLGLGVLARRAGAARRCLAVGRSLEETSSGPRG